MDASHQVEDVRGLPTRPFRFGIMMAAAPDGTGWRDQARRVEDLGYSTLFVSDHFTDQWAPIVALTIAAEATTTLNVGSLVFDNDYRHPVELAREMATLGLASAGRLECGVGAGWLQSDYDQLGMALDAAGVRIERLSESLPIMRDIWTRGESTRAGKHYNVTAARGLSDHPTHPPRLVVGGGGKRVLGLAARHADIVGFNPSIPDGMVTRNTAASATPEAFEERVRWVREAAGDRLDDLEFLMFTYSVHVGGDGARILADPSVLHDSPRRLPGHLADLLPDRIAEIPVFLIGTVDDVCDTLIERRERYGFNYWVVHPENLDSFAPVAARLTGK